MYRLHIEIRGLTASFRVPHMYKYHRSLPLPPYTSVVGMFGAAIGKDMATAQEIFKSLKLKVGIAGSYAGGCNDTWRVLTTKNPENDVVERQILFKPIYHILFCGDESPIRFCERAFSYPVYPLSLGRPDDIANVIVHDISECEPENLQILSNTVVIGVPSAQADESLFDIDKPINTGPCTLLYRLPVHFLFENGFAYERTADEFRDFTFIGNHPITLKEQVKGFKIEINSLAGELETLNIPILEI
ncbi:CRISPR-associated protein Cas5 [Candidatus Methanoperedens nitratireducens]|nr:CRISPR-associated protein Cas5 [Candidatus Methanoperedens nitroreducens]